MAFDLQAHIGIPPGEFVKIDYTNWKGERGVRRIWPLNVSFGSNKYHAPQWLLHAIDVDKNVLRTFALAKIHSWEPDRGP